MMSLENLLKGLRYAGQWLISPKLLIRRRILELALSFPAIALGAVVTATPALSVPVTFSAVDSQFDPGTNNQDWRSATTSNSDLEPNTFTGHLSSGNILPSFFTLDLQGFNLAPNETTVGATLSLFTSSITVVDGVFETLGMLFVVLTWPFRALASLARR